MRYVILSNLAFVLGGLAAFSKIYWSKIYWGQ